jgi:hypothetical protein
MRSRVLGAVLVGLGVLALVIAGGLAFVVAPSVAQLPYDMERTQSVAEAPDAQFLQITDGVAKVESGTLRSTVTVQADTKATAELEAPLDGEALVWLVGSETVRTDTDELVSAYSTSLAVDRKTAAAQDWDKQWLDTGNERQSVDYSGQIYKFPFATERQTYEIFDRDILDTRPARFVQTEEIQGLETYQFTQEIRDEVQEVPDDRLQVLLSQLLPGATSGEVRYSNIRSVWVEPTTGQYIRVREEQDKSLVASDGRSATLLDATFTYTDDTINRAAQTASDNRRRLTLVTVAAPTVLAILGLVVLILGIVLAARRPRAAGAAVPAQRGDEPRRGKHAADGRDGSPADAPPAADPARAERSGSTPP